MTNDHQGGCRSTPLAPHPKKGVFRSCGSAQRRRLWKLLSEGTRRVAGAVLFPAGNKTAPLSKCVAPFRQGTGSIFASENLHPQALDFTLALKALDRNRASGSVGGAV